MDTIKARLILDSKVDDGDSCFNNQITNHNQGMF